MVVLDSTFLIDFLKNKPSAVSKVKSFSDQVYTTRLNIFELLVGAYRKNNEHELSVVLDLAHSINILELDDKSALKAAQIQAELMQKGEMSPEIDVLIASIALSNGDKTIVTQNVKDFVKIPGIKVESY